MTKQYAITMMIVINKCRSLCAIYVSFFHNQVVWRHWYACKWDVGVYLIERDQLQSTLLSRVAHERMGISVSPTWDHYDDLQATHYTLVSDYLNF